MGTRIKNDKQNNIRYDGKERKKWLITKKYLIVRKYDNVNKINIYSTNTIMEALTTDTVQFSPASSPQ